MITRSFSSHLQETRTETSSFSGCSELASLHLSFYSSCFPGDSATSWSIFQQLLRTTRRGFHRKNLQQSSRLYLRKVQDLGWSRSTTQRQRSPTSKQQQTLKSPQHELAISSLISLKTLAFSQTRSLGHAHKDVRRNASQRLHLLEHNDPWIRSTRLKDEVKRSFTPFCSRPRSRSASSGGSHSGAAPTDSKRLRSGLAKVKSGFYNSTEQRPSRSQFPAVSVKPKSFEKVEDGL